MTSNVVPTPRDAPIAEDLVDLFARFSRLLRTRFRASLDPLGVTPSTARALGIIVHHPDIRMSDVAEALHVSPRSVTTVVDTLVESGYVRRLDNPDDRRTVCLKVTDNGSALHQRIGELRERVAREIFDGLSPMRQHDLHEILADLLGFDEEGQPK